MGDFNFYMVSGKVKEDYRDRILREESQKYDEIINRSKGAYRMKLHNTRTGGEVKDGITKE